MGFWAFLFGQGVNQLSTQPRALSEEEIRELVSRSRILTLVEAEKRLIQETILQVRGNDGFVSLRQIDQALQKLVTQGKISKNDHWAVRDAFKHFFTQQ